MHISAQPNPAEPSPLNGRAGEIRTPDLLHPMQARYQATLRPEQKGASTSRIAGAEASGFFVPPPG